MKEGWEVKELGSLANFVRGPFGGSLKKDCFVKEGIAVYEQQHAIYNQFEEIRYFITDEKFNELKRFELSPNDLIMSCSGTMGKVAIVPKEIKKGIINQALLKITCSKFLYNRFLELYMKSVTFQELLNKDAKGAAIKNVASVKDLKAMPIPIPPLQEQQAIVEKLDTAFAYIDQAKEQLQRNIENAKQLFQSQLNQIFSQKGDDWEEKKLGEVCLKITDGSHNPPKGIELSSHLMLSSKNILDDKITYDNPRYLSEVDFLSENKRTDVKEGDVLLTIVGTIGRVAVVPKLSDYFVLQRSVAVLKPNHTLMLSRYMKYILRSLLKVLEHSARGVAQKGIYLKQLKEFPISFPKSLETQQQIVNQLDQMAIHTQELEQNYHRQLTNLEELRKSILEKAFKGELV